MKIPYVELSFGGALYFLPFNYDERVQVNFLIESIVFTKLTIKVVTTSETYEKQTRKKEMKLKMTATTRNKTQKLKTSQIT